MRTIGLTGGIGSGKSTVARMLQELGVCLIDADAISRQSTLAGGAAIAKIQQAFGNAVLTGENALDRDAMRTLVADQPQARAQLEAIIHPIVAQEIAAQRFAASRAGIKLAVIDIPLLAEAGSHWRSQLDEIWVVDCLPETQMSRVQVRNKWPRSQVDAILAAQACRVQRLGCADAVIYNEAMSFDQLRKIVVKMALPLL